MIKDKEGYKYEILEELNDINVLKVYCKELDLGMYIHRDDPDYEEVL